MQADIENLALERRCDCVLLASGLIDHPEAATRNALLRTAHRQLERRGRVLVQSQSPRWLATAEVGPAGERDGLSTFVEAVSRSGSTITMTLRYALAADVWRQSFTVVALDEAAVEGLLVEAGFIAFEWFGAGRRWIAGIAA